MKDASTSLVVRMGQRYGVEPAAVYDTLRKTIVRTDNASDAQVMALMIVAERHNLDPFTKEIYAYPDKRGGIVPVIGVDGWIRKVLEHPQFDGWQFAWDAEEGSMTCTIWRKDKLHPVTVTEYLNECKRGTEVWNSMPKRMMRNRAAIQAARFAFGFAGLHDPHDAHLVANADDDEVAAPAPARSAREAIRAQAAKPAAADEPLPMVEEVPPEAASAEAEPEPEPNAVGLYMQRLLAADNDDDAAQVVDEARFVLDGDDYKSLVSAYRARPNPERE